MAAKKTTKTSKKPATASKKTAAKKTASKKTASKKTAPKKTAKTSKAKKYGAKTESTMKRVMHEEKHGTLRSGGSGRKVTSRKQAIAIGLSEARAAGAKVPPNPNEKSAKRSTKKKR